MINEVIIKNYSTFIFIFIDSLLLFITSNPFESLILFKYIKVFFSIFLKHIFLFTNAISLSI